MFCRPSQGQINSASQVPGLYRKEDVTPYMHVFSQHIPEFLQNLKEKNMELRVFSTSSIEKKTIIRYITFIFFLKPFCLTNLRLLAETHLAQREMPKLVYSSETAEMPKCQNRPKLRNCRNLRNCKTSFIHSFGIIHNNILYEFRIVSAFFIFFHLHFNKKHQHILFYCFIVLFVIYFILL